MPRVVLIHPPVTIPSEPPAGIARLSHVLSRQGVPCALIDANLAGLTQILLGSAHGEKYTGAIRRGTAFRSMDHYRLTVHRLNRILTPPDRHPWRLTLANYRHHDRIPVRSADLIRQSEHPEDNPFFAYYEDGLLPGLESQAPDIIGISLLYLTQALCAFALIGCIRRRFPEIRIVLGGGLITSWMSAPDWRDPFAGLVDACISGPGESALLALTKAGPAGRGTEKPDYRPLPVQTYLSPGFVLPAVTSSGCYWRRCTFCPERAEGGAFRPFPAEAVRSGLREDVERFSPALVHFLDNAVPPKTLAHFTAHPPGVPWYGYSRLEPHLDDPDFCSALHKSGCVMLQLGLESGSANVLERMEKGISLDRVPRILTHLKNAGIATYLYLLFGTPAETEADAQLTRDFVLRHADKIGFINPALFNLPRHSPETAALRTRSFYDGDLSLYVDFEHPAGWHRRTVRRFLQSDFGKHPVIARILHRTPPEFTSTHAPFFLENFRPVLPRSIQPGTRN